MVERVRVGGGSSALGRTFAAGGAGAAMLDSIGDLAGSLQEAKAREQQDKDMVTSVEDRTRFVKAVDAKVTELDPAQPDYSERVAEIYNDERAAILEGSKISTPGVRRDLEARLAAISGEAEVRAVQTSRESTRKRAFDALADAENEMIAGIEEDPDGAPVFEDQFASAFAAAGETIPASAREALFDEVMDKATSARIRGLARAGRRDEAEAMLKEEAGTFSTAQRKEIERDIRVISGELAVGTAANNANAVADLEVAILRNEAGVTEVEQADKDGVFSNNPRLKATLLRQIQTRDRRIMEGLEAKVDIMQRYEAGAGLKNRKEADAAFQERAATLGPNPSASEVTDMMAEVTLRAGIMPESGYRLVRAGNASDQPGQVAAAIDIHSAVIARSPTADTGASQRIQAGAAMTRVLGLNSGAAAELLIKNEPTGNVRRERVEIFDKEMDFDSEDFIEGMGFDEIPQGMRADVRSMVRQFYVQSGNLEIAEAAAEDLIGSQYGTTETGGIERMVKRPPEMYGLPGNMVGPGVDPEVRTQIIDEMIQGFLTERGLEPAIPLTTEEEVLITPGVTKSPSAELTGPVPSQELREQSTLPPWKLTMIEGTNPPQYVIGLLNDLGKYSKVGIWKGATDEEAKSTEAWQTWSENQRMVATKEAARQRALDRLINEELETGPGAF